MRTSPTGLILAMACVTLGACGSREDAPKEKAGPAADSRMTLTEADRGRTLPATVGMEIAIVLATVPGTGYSWVVADSALSVLQLLEAPAVARDSTAAALPGAPTTATSRFRAARAGTGTVRLEYRRPWETEAAAAQQYEVTFEVGDRRS